MTEEEIDALVARAWRDAAKTSGVICAVVAAGIFAAWSTGKVPLSLPADWGKVLAILGIVVAGWGGYYGKDGTPAASWSGARRDEVLRRRLFAWTVAPGLLLAVLGTLLS